MLQKAGYQHSSAMLPPTPHTFVRLPLTNLLSTPVRHFSLSRASQLDTAPYEASPNTWEAAIIIPDSRRGGTNTTALDDKIPPASPIYTDPLQAQPLRHIFGGEFPLPATVRNRRGIPCRPNAGQKTGDACLSVILSW